MLWWALFDYSGASCVAFGPEDGIVASEAELRAWDMHQLECMRQLGQWKVRSADALFVCVPGRWTDPSRFQPILGPVLEFLGEIA